MAKHAYLSASSSARWIACTPSAELCARMPNESSPYAEQGTDAHSLCEHLLLKALGRKTRDPTEDLTFYDAEMQSAAEGYRDFIMEQVEEAKKLCPDPFVAVEQRLNFSRWVPEGFGTGDCVIVADGLIHICDFKYGVGVVVSAEKNTQLMCYALGAYDAFGDLYDIQTVKLSIYQPRREHVETYEMSLSDLLTWADTVLVPAAKLAYTGEGDFHAGPHCQFCKVKATCRERASYNMELAKFEFSDPDLLSDEEIAEILAKADHLVSWAGDVKDYALEQALAGKHYDGYKVVEGRSTRKYSDEGKVAEVVEAAGFDPYEKKLKGITAMTSELGKKKFNELLSSLIYKPPGKPVLVCDSDKRPEYHTAINDFKDNE
ncbi:DUF2800 domain-containing protein [Bilifractor sp. LCP19S3_H10]|uniref:DUF2800 domain-containing protein n=1 Tax=Bilifractor sp. LCP19S3_H10 TaxID=3438736 RepID=UPI003F9260CF